MLPCCMTRTHSPSVRSLAFGIVACVSGPPFECTSYIGIVSQAAVYHQVFLQHRSMRPANLGCCIPESLTVNHSYWDIEIRAYANHVKEFCVG